MRRRVFFLREERVLRLLDSKKNVRMGGESVQHLTDFAEQVRVADYK